MGYTSQRVQEEEEPVPSAPTTPTSPHDDEADDEDDRQQPHTALSWRILVGAEDDEIRCWSTPVPKDYSIHHLQHNQGISSSMVLFSSACSPS